jgi:uncharacterized damage-inducible protein DinB
MKESEMPAHVPPVADEREALLGFLEHQRQIVRRSAHGLTDRRAAERASASSLCVGSVIKHLAMVERSWMQVVRQEPGAMTDFAAYEDGFRFDPGDSLADVLADYEQAAAETEKCVAEYDDLGEPVPVPRGVPWLPQDVEAWSLRWVLLHLIEETARHAGHADVIRESVDGATAYELLAASEGER